MHVLFVCSGNTCRSPLAEALFRRLLSEAGRTDVTVSSAGTGAYDSAPASEGSYLVALERGLDLTAHRALHLSRHPSVWEGRDRGRDPVALHALLHTVADAPSLKAPGRIGNNEEDKRSYEINVRTVTTQEVHLTEHCTCW